MAIIIAALCMSHLSTSVDAALSECPQCSGCAATNITCPLSCTDCTTITSQCSCQVSCSFSGCPGTFTQSGQPYMDDSCQPVALRTRTCIKDCAPVTSDQCVGCRLGRWGSPQCNGTCPGGTIESSGSASGCCNGKGTFTSTLTSNGACVCSSGYYGNACQWSRYGTCNNHGDPSAMNGKCTCDTGYTGPSCNECAVDYYPDTSTTCKYCTAAITCNGRGTCSPIGSCQCNSNIIADASCSGSLGCAPNYYNPPSCTYCSDVVTCGGNNGGKCNTLGGCDCPSSGFIANCTNCKPGYYGSSCTACPSTPLGVCNGRGTCNSGIWGTGSCTCQLGAYGPACEYTDAITCNGHGTASYSGACVSCTTGWDISKQCGTCLTDYYGTNCTYCKSGSSMCRQGTCNTDSGKCVCNIGYNGTICDSCEKNYYRSISGICTYCLASTTCNGGGICNPTGGGTCTQCTTPRTGAYCEICPSGRYGPACDFCPGFNPVGGSAADACGGSTRGFCNSGLYGNGTCICIPPATGRQCKAPVITQVTLASPYVSPVAGGLTISVSGSLFGTRDAISNITFYGYGQPTVCSTSDAPIWTPTVIVCSTQFAEPWDLSLLIPGGVQLAVVTSEGTSYTAVVAYEPPVITTVTPSTDGPLVGGNNVTLTGRSFGLVNMIVRVNGHNLSTSAITSRSNTKLIFTMPAGSGVAEITVALAGQISNTLTYSYMSPIVTSITPAMGLSTYGGDLVVIRGLNFGASLALAASYLDVLILNNGIGVMTRNDTVVTFRTAAGSGNLTGVLRLSNGLSIVDTPIILHYQQPQVINVTGCAGNQMDAVFGCVEGNIITVTGVHFGPTSQVESSLLVAIYPIGVTSAVLCDQVTVTIAQIQFTCRLPRGAGVNLNMGVSYGSLVTGRPLISYVGPHLDPGALRFLPSLTTIGSILGESRVTGTSTLGGDVLTIVGSNFGMSATDIWIPYGAGTNYLQFDHNCTNVILTNATYLTCATQRGVGRNFRFAVVVQGLPSRVSDDTFSYPAPIIVSGTLRVVTSSGSLSTPAIAIDATTTQGDKLMFIGNHFGQLASQLIVTYAANATSVSSSNSNALGCSVDSSLSNVTHIFCQASPGEGANKLFTVTTGALYGDVYRSVVTGTDVYSYPTTPIITGVTGCTSVSGQSGTIDCPTDARADTLGNTIQLTITGQFLPAYPLVTIGSQSCENPFNDILTPTSKLTCTLPVGSGLLQPVVISKGSYFSIARDALLVSYALPSIESITGCGITGIVGYEGQIFCPRTGGIRVTITGTNFGFASAKVIIGGQPCTSVIHTYKNEHRQVSCMLPAGTGMARGILLFQLGSEKKGSQSVTLSYEPCAAGTIQSAVVATSCTPCAQGSFASKAGQDKCIMCTAGTQAQTTGLSTCTSCIAGRFAASQNSSSCSACPLGKYISTIGAAECLSCGTGTMVNVTGAIQCSQCSPGRATSVIGATICDICQAGKSAVAGQATCLDCPKGTITSMNESSICLPCLHGSFASVGGLTRCDSCAPGSYTVSGGGDLCGLCERGTYAASYNQTACIQCDAGKISTVLGSSICEPCPKGQFVSAKGSVSCLLCPSGKFAPVNSSSECTACGIGSYQNTTGQSFCYQANIGQFVSSTGQFGSQQCQPGTYSSSISTGVCISCAAGKYSNTFGSIECIDAPRGAYTQFPGLQMYDLCPIGRYSNATNQTLCEQCAIGSSQPSVGQTSCIECSDGTITSIAGAVTCTPCAAGSLSNPLHTACITCIAGTITNGAGRLLCDSCAMGTFGRTSGLSFCSTCAVGSITNATASTTCINCEPGRYADASATSCQLCSAGYYSGKIPTSQCTPCAIGQYQSNQGATTCTACPLGSVQSGTGAASCDPCEPGFIMNQEGGRECQPCAVGYIQPFYNSTVCLPCLDGTYSATTGGSECFDCQPGTIGSINQGQHIRCVACQAGSYSNDTALTACFTCAPGSSQVNLGQTTCTSCTYGKYSAAIGLSNCLPCDAGYASGTGATECSACMAGYYADGKSSLSTCVACSSGTYSPQPRSGTCTPCSTGRYNPNTNATACTFCDPGQFQLLDGQSSCDTCTVGRVGMFVGDVTTATEACQACGVGTYANVSGQAECTACEAGKFQSNTGQSQCDPCPQGFYQPLTSQSTCRPCDAGTAQPYTGRESCITCGVGETQSLAGQSSCLPCTQGRYAVSTILCASCQSGRFSNSSGATECIPCGKGTFNALTGQESCTPCALGFVQALTEQSSCTPCESGYYADASLREVGCAKCLSGTYMPNTQAGECLNCPKGRWAAIGATTCTKCSAGRYQANETQSGCDACPAGTYQSQDGQSACVPCDVGMFSSGGGLASCSPCIGATVAPQVGTPSCTVCDEEAVADATHENCICRAGYYAASEPDITGHLACIVCPYGADCALAGKTLVTIQTVTGFWRSGNDSALFYRCLLPAHCQAATGADNNICLNHRTGILCAQCEDGYRSHSGVSKCLECPREGTSVVITVFFCIAVVLGILLLYWGVVRIDRDLLEQLKAEDKKNVYWDRVDDEPMDDDADNKAKAAAAAVAKTQENGKKIINAAMARGMVTYKIKIMVGFMQIVTNMAVVLDVAWPSYFQSFTSFFSWINLDFVPWQSVGCVSPFTFYTKLIAITVTPIGLVFLICVFFLLPLNYMARKKYSAAESQYQVAKQKRIRRVFWKLVLFSLFLLYPGVSSSVLSVFVCRDINGEPYLLADFSLRCYSSDWMQALPLTIIMLLVYPIGVPLFFFHVLYRYRYRRDEAGVRLQVGFLYEAYESQSWWFELCDMAFKLSMTSVLAFLPAQIQLQFGMAFCGAFIILLLLRPPYKRKGDFRLHMVGCTELLLMCMAGQTIIVQGTYLERSVDIALSALFIGICVLMFVIFCYIAFANLIKILRAIDWKAVGHALRTCNCRDICNGSKRSSTVKLATQSSSSKLGASNDDDTEFGSTNGNGREVEMTSIDTMNLNSPIGSPLSPTSPVPSVDNSLMAAARRDRARERANDDTIMIMDNTRASSHTVVTEMKAGGIMMSSNPLFAQAHIDPFGQPVLQRAVSGNDTLARALARQPSADQLVTVTAASSSSSNDTTTGNGGGAAPAPSNLELRRTDSDDPNRIM